MRDCDRFFLTHVFNKLHAAGWRITAGNDGGDENEKLTGINDALELIASVCEATIYVRHVEKPDKRAMLLIIPNNGGAEQTIADYSDKAGFADVLCAAIGEWEDGADEIVIPMIRAEAARTAPVTAAAAIDALFCNVCEAYGIEHGDMSPEDTIALDVFVDEIQRIVNRFLLARDLGHHIPGYRAWRDSMQRLPDLGGAFPEIGDLGMTVPGLAFWLPAVSLGDAPVLAGYIEQHPANGCTAYHLAIGNQEWVEEVTEEGTDEAVVEKLARILWSQYVVPDLTNLARF